MNTNSLSNSDYAVCLEQAPVFLWRARPDTLRDFFNQRWLSFRGCTFEQEAGTGWIAGLHPDDRADYLTHYLEAFGRRGAFEAEFRLLRHDGVYRRIVDRAVPITNADGSFNCYMGSSIELNQDLHTHDIERRVQEELLLQLRGLEVIGSLASGVADDFNNILTVIMGAAVLLQKRLTDQPDLGSLVELIQNSCERAARLSSSLMYFSRRQSDMVNQSVLDHDSGKKLRSCS